MKLSEEELNLLHKEMWAMVDYIAEKEGVSVSKLATKAGLTNTALLPSKRFTGSYKQRRWLNVETIFKILAATNNNLSDVLKSYLKLKG